MKVLLLFLFCFIFLFNLISSKKKKTIEELREINRPSGITDELYCLSCIIPTDTIINRIKPNDKELEILDVVTESCNQKKGFYNQFKELYKPSLIKDACDIFIMNWESKIIKEVKKEFKINKKLSNDFQHSIINSLCYDITKACEKETTYLKYSAVLKGEDYMVFNEVSEKSKQDL